MSAQFRIVSAILDEAKYRFDIQGQDDRHTPTDLLRSFNDSAQKLQTKVSNMGFDFFLTPTSTLTLPIVAAATGETYAEVDWPIDAARIYQFHVLFEQGLWLPLKPVTLSGIRDYQRSNSLINGYSTGPVAFALRQAPFGVTSTETAGKIMLVPLPTVARSYRIFYLKHFTSMLSTDTFNGMENFVEWILWDMGVKIASRDNDAANTYQIAVTERDRVEQEIAVTAPRTQNAASYEPRRADDGAYDDWSPRALL